MNLETRRIKELQKDVFWVLLWCPVSSLLKELLDPSVGYVLCWDHDVGNYSWQDFRVPVARPERPLSVSARLVNFDFVLPTDQFVELLPELKPAIKVVQLGRRPPDYLDMRRIKGKELYRLLRECDWRVLLDTPANDYGQLMSPRREVLERALALTSEER